MTKTKIPECYLVYENGEICEVTLVAHVVKILETLGARVIDNEERRALAQAVYETIGPEVNEDGDPLCPKCGCVADFDGTIWFCPQTECDGYLQTVKEPDDDDED